MKRILTAVLALCLLTALAMPAFGAETGNSAVQTVKALGILTGDENGNTDLSGKVSRAEFAFMLAAASSYKDSVSREGSGYSLFKDVKNGHWASEAIQLSIQQGWMTGYTNGTFRPEQSVTLEEACAALLKLLGYDASSLAGSFPQAQLSKASALGLRDQVSAVRGQALNRQNCVNLFYNLLTAKTSDGQTYGVTLGYTVTNGEVDYTSVALENVSGPYVADSDFEQLPFEPATIYKNDKEIKSVSMLRNDVYYYNQGAGTLWIYTKKVSGRIESLSPSTTSPTSVTIAGITYDIGSSTASYKLSAMGGGRAGGIVTLLLGMNDGVVDVLTGEAVDITYYGMVQSTSETVNDEKATVEKAVTVLCTDGVTRTFTAKDVSQFGNGVLVSVDVGNDKLTIRRLNQKTTNGKVSADTSTLGKLRLAPDIQILDTSLEGDALVVEPDRLAGANLKHTDVRYYSLNRNSEIECLILKDATGDTWNYGYLTGAYNNKEEDGPNDYIYACVSNGEKVKLETGTEDFHLEANCGIAYRYNASGEVKSIKAIAEVQLTELGTFTARADNKTYDLAEDLQVYLKEDGTYYLTERETVDAENYRLTGFYDNLGCPAGGLIRVIIAEEK